MKTAQNAMQLNGVDHEKESKRAKTIIGCMAATWGVGLAVDKKTQM